MRSARIEANLAQLLIEYPQEGVAELIEAKKSGAEKQSMPASEVERHEGKVQRLVDELCDARDRTSLPDAPSAFDELDAILLRVRGLS